MKYVVKYLFLRINQKNIHYEFRILVVLLLFFGLNAVKTPLGRVPGVREAIKACVEANLSCLALTPISPNWRGCSTFID